MTYECWLITHEYFYWSKCFHIYTPVQLSILSCMQSFGAFWKRERYSCHMLQKIMNGMGEWGMFTPCYIEKCKRKNCDGSCQLVTLTMTFLVSETFSKNAVCHLATFKFMSESTPLREASCSCEGLSVSSPHTVGVSGSVAQKSQEKTVQTRSDACRMPDQPLGSQG